MNRIKSKTQKKVSTIENKTQPEDPIDILMQEHAMGLKRLKEIASAADSIKVNGFSAKAFKKITDAASFIGTEMRRHNDREERYLFPLLDKHVIESPNVARHERREIWQTFNDLLMSVKDVEDGRIHGTTIRELIQSALTVVERFQKQIEKENTIIFPMVKRVLRSEEYKQLRQNIISVI